MRPVLVWFAQAEWVLVGSGRVRYGWFRYDPVRHGRPCSGGVIRGLVGVRRGSV